MREFTVIRSRRRTMALQVTREGQVVVRAPICAARGEIHRFVTEHEAWIAAQQARQSCENVGAILRASGADFSNVVKTTCFLADMADFSAFNEVYARHFISNPARSCVAVKTLPKGVLCEIEAIAVK